MHNASLAIKASEVHHQAESLEALKGAEQGGDNTPSRHLGSCVQQKWGHGPQDEQQHVKTRGEHEGTGLVVIGMSTQTHAGEKKAPEPRKRTNQLLNQRVAPKSRANYHHGPLQEHQNSANSKWQGECRMN